jgi:NAD(P)-dependent dehydrogenase (short-subunit alcohol dehydrogenase family)
VSGEGTTLSDLFGLAGKRAIVTGGGSGLGLQIAEGLAEAGADLMLCARKLERCEEAAELLAAAHGVRVLARACDVRDADQVEAVVAATETELGGVDVLVNNSGTSWGAPAIDYPEEAWRKVLDVNLTGTFFFSQSVGRRMIAGDGGAIVNLASVLGFRGAPAAVVDAVAYNASKGGVVALTRDLAVKWAPEGIRVNAVAPGWFPTDMSEQVIDRGRDQFLDRIPLGRFGGSADLKGAVLFLAAPAAGYITGQTIVIDGGQSIS